MRIIRTPKFGSKLLRFFDGSAGVVQVVRERRLGKVEFKDLVSDFLAPRLVDAALITVPGNVEKRRTFLVILEDRLVKGHALLVLFHRTYQLLPFRIKSPRPSEDRGVLSLWTFLCKSQRCSRNILREKKLQNMTVADVKTLANI